MEKFGRFTILEPLAQGRIRSYRAWDSNSKEVVLLHLGWQSEEETKLFRQDGVREQGRLNQDIYLVTLDKPQFLDLNLLAEGDAVSRTISEADLSRRGRWTVPVRENASESGGSEFTRMFQQWAEPAAQGASVEAASNVSSAPVAKQEAVPLDPSLEATQLMAAPGISPAPVISPVDAVVDLPEKAKIPSGTLLESQVIRVGASRPAEPNAARENPGEFTRMFQASPNPAVTPAVEPDAKSADERPANLPEAGEFTRLFQAPPTPKASPVKPPPARKEEQGEFTKRFSTPFHPAVPAPVRQPAPNPPFPSESNPAPNAPGEFTRQFQQPPHAPSSVQPDRSVAANEEKNEFERVYSSPLADMGREIDFQALEKTPPPAGAPSPKSAGAFTEAFGRPFVHDPRPEPAGRSRGGPEQANATVLFQTSMPPPLNTNPAKPSEFTQAFGRPPINFSAEPAQAPLVEAAAQLARKPVSKVPIGALILIGAAAIVIVVLLLLFLFLRR